MVTKGTMSGWHNVSTNQSNLNIDGVQINDYVNIIENFAKRAKIHIIDLLDTNLHDHVTNEDNPHKVKIEQIDKVINKLYDTWLMDGYKGSIETFKSIIFENIVLATEEEMLEGIFPDKVTSVAVFKYALNLHEENIHAHNTIFSKFISGTPLDIEPTFSYHKSLGRAYQVKDLVGLDFPQNSLVTNIPWNDSDWSMVINTPYLPISSLKQVIYICKSKETKDSIIVEQEANSKIIIVSFYDNNVLSYTKIIDTEEHDRLRLIITFSLSDKIYTFHTAKGSTTLIEVSNKIRSLNTLCYGYGSITPSCEQFYYYPKILNEVQVATLLNLTD